MSVRGVRGAITVDENSSEEILSGTEELFKEIIRNNQMEAEQVASLWLTVTEDLNADFPAKAIRSVSGWDFVPLMCSTEIPVPGGVEKCIRILMHINTEKGQKEIKHVYLKGAQVLRPDLIGD